MVIVCMIFFVGMFCLLLSGRTFLGTDMGFPFIVSPNVIFSSLSVYVVLEGFTLPFFFF